jgi:hypothetical protein
VGEEGGEVVGLLWLHVWLRVWLQGCGRVGWEKTTAERYTTVVLIRLGGLLANGHRDTHARQEATEVVGPDTQAQAHGGEVLRARHAADVR